MGHQPTRCFESKHLSKNFALEWTILVWPMMLQFGMIDYEIKFSSNK
jgi:hypothetical protein